MQKKISRLYSIFDDIGDAVYEDKVFTQPCLLNIKIVFSPFSVHHMILL